MKAAVSAELDLLSDLERQGVRLWHARGRLRYRGPRGTLDAVLPILRERRDALLALLSPPLDADGLPDGPCPACGGAYFWSDDGEAWTCARCEPADHTPREILTVPRPGWRVLENGER